MPDELYIYMYIYITYYDRLHNCLWLYWLYFCIRQMLVVLAGWLFWMGWMAILDGLDGDVFDGLWGWCFLCVF